MGDDFHDFSLKNMYSLAFGPPLLFLTPNLADKLMPMLLIAGGHRIDLDCTEPAMPSRQAMDKFLAADAISQARAFEAMMVLFFIHVTMCSVHGRLVFP